MLSLIISLRLLPLRSPNDLLITRQGAFQCPLLPDLSVHLTLWTISCFSTTSSSWAFSPVFPPSCLSPCPVLAPLLSLSPWHQLSEDSVPGHTSSLGESDNAHGFNDHCLWLSSKWISKFSLQSFRPKYVEASRNFHLDQHANTEFMIFFSWT